MIDQKGQLYMSNVEMADDGSEFKCETAHKVTHATEISEVGGKLRITDPSSGIPPRIVKTLSDITATVGETVVIPCIGHGYPSPTYRYLGIFKIILVHQKLIKI